MATEKRCSKCDDVKPTSEFYKDRRTSEDGLRSRCKACSLAAGRVYAQAHREERKANVKAWVAENPERIRNIYLKSRHGISAAEYNALYESQNGCCAVCGHIPDGRRLSVDHDHATGAVRGLLCRNCNLVLGHVKDRVIILLRLAEYLESSAQ